MRADKLSKMSMPKKPLAEEEADMDLGLELPEDDMEMPMEDDMEGLDMEGADILEDVDDMLLIEEMKKRGLSLDDGEEEDLEMGEEDEFDMGDEEDLDI